jgi:hypothetical protein
MNEKETERYLISGDGSEGYDNPWHTIRPGGFVNLNSDGNYEVTAKKAKVRIHRRKDD